MKVTANDLLNYIRCRRYASLNDSSLESHASDFDVNSRNYYQEFLDIFYLNFNQFFKEKATNINNICTSLVNNFAKFNFTLKCFYLVKDKNLQPL